MLRWQQPSLLLLLRIVVIIVALLWVPIRCQCVDKEGILLVIVIVIIKWNGRRERRGASQYRRVDVKQETNGHQQDAQQTDSQQQ